MKQQLRSEAGRRQCCFTLCVCFCVPLSLNQNENPYRSETSVREKKPLCTQSLKQHRGQPCLIFGRSRCSFCSGCLRSAAGWRRNRFTLCVCFCVPLSLNQNENPLEETSVREIYKALIHAYLAEGLVKSKK